MYTHHYSLCNTLPSPNLKSCCWFYECRPSLLNLSSYVPRETHFLIPSLPLYDTYVCGLLYYTNCFNTNSDPDPEQDSQVMRKKRVCTFYCICTCICHRSSFTDGQVDRCRLLRDPSLNLLRPASQAARLHWPAAQTPRSRARPQSRGKVGLDLSYQSAASTRTRCSMAVIVPQDPRLKSRF